MKKSLLLGLSALLLTTISSCSTNSKVSISESSSTSTTKVEKKILVEQPDTKEKLKKFDKLKAFADSLNESSYKTGIGIEDFERYSSENKGNKAFFLAKVIQVIDDPYSDYIRYLGTVTPEKNIYKTVVLEVPKDHVYVKILENDEIRVLVRYRELYQYENTQGLKKSVPLFEIDAYSNVTATE